MTFPSKTIPLARMFSCAVMGRRVSWFLQQNTEAVYEMDTCAGRVARARCLPGNGRGSGNQAGAAAAQRSAQENFGLA